VRKRLIAVAVVAVTMSAGVAYGAGGATTMPTVLRAGVLSYAASTKEGYGGAVPYASPVSAASLAQFGPRNPTGTACVATICYSLGTYGGGFEYPVRSTDGGRTWRNAGHWFAGAWADGAAFASRMKVFSASVAAAWFPGQNTFYFTSSAGRKWYSAWPPGAITALTGPNGGETVVMHVTSYAPARARYLYRTSDGGRTWRLVRGAGVPASSPATTRGDSIPNDHRSEPR